MGIQTGLCHLHIVGNTGYVSAKVLEELEHVYSGLLHWLIREKVNFDQSKAKCLHYQYTSKTLETLPIKGLV